MTTKFIKIDYKYFCFFILVFLSSCDMDNKSFFDRVLSDDNIIRDPRAFHTENSYIGKRNYAEEFNKYISKDYTRYHFDILLDDKLTLGKDSIYFPVYKYNVNPENDYYGLWLLNLKTLKFESKYKLNNNTLFYFNDFFRKHSKIIIPPDTLIYVNFDSLKVVNFKKNELIFEDSLNESTKVAYGKYYIGNGLITYIHPYIYTLNENSIINWNIITKEKDSILVNNYFNIKNFICHKDSIILFGYDKLQGTNQTCILNTKNNKMSFKDLNINFYNDKIDILEVLKFDKSILILTNLGIFEYNLDRKLVEKIFNVQIDHGYIKISNNILTLVSYENDQQYITRYDITLRNLISKRILPLGCFFVTNSVYISEGGTGLYIVEE